MIDLHKLRDVAETYFRNEFRFQVMGRQTANSGLADFHGTRGDTYLTFRYMFVDSPPEPETETHYSIMMFSAFHGALESFVEQIRREGDDLVVWRHMLEFSVERQISTNYRIVKIYGCLHTMKLIDAIAARPLGNMVVQDEDSLGVAGADRQTAEELAASEDQRIEMSGRQNSQDRRIANVGFGGLASAPPAPILTPDDRDGESVTWLNRPLGPGDTRPSVPPAPAQRAYDDARQARSEAVDAGDRITEDALNTSIDHAGRRGRP